jgi:hypothetical protein
MSCDCIAQLEPHDCGNTLADMSHEERMRSECVQQLSTEAGVDSFLVGDQQGRLEYATAA